MKSAHKKHQCLRLEEERQRRGAATAGVNLIENLLPLMTGCGHSCRMCSRSSSSSSNASPADASSAEEEKGIRRGGTEHKREFSEGEGREGKNMKRNIGCRMEATEM